MKQIEADKSYLRMAKIWAENSKARRLKVGALIVKDKAIISDGFNGTPSGFDNNCEYEYWGEREDGECICCDRSSYGCEDCQQAVKKLKTKPEVLHAEANAITKVAKSTQSSDGATIYITHAPCVECSKLIIQSGIARVVYNHDYRSKDGINLLEKAGVKIDHIEEV